MVPASGAKAFHWFGAIMTVPFGVGALFSNNAEQVHFKLENTALALPRPFLIFCSRMVHLTMVSHEMTAGYFLWALLRDHGVLERKSKSVDSMEIFFAVATAMAIFIAIVFWACVAIDPGLMVPMKNVFPSDFKPELMRRLLFQAMFGPADPDPRCKWQRPFGRFMVYIHSFCPLLLVADVLVVPHVPCAWEHELRAAVFFTAGYLAWNFFCWWLLRMAPYPLQAEIYRQGIPRALAAYFVLVAFAIGLVRYARSLRLWASGNSLLSLLLLSAPVLAVVWASNGFVPFRMSLARFQRLQFDAKGNLLTCAVAEAGRNASE
mmetsp:Transcript_67708/g.177562  ORF Transcript_67708/g.177562 Transcript_67708/m.177562 type:complete len:320 (-) Transcript_67708:64-1023(-)